MIFNFQFLVKETKCNQNGKFQGPKERPEALSKPETPRVGMPKAEHRRRCIFRSGTSKKHGWGPRRQRLYEKFTMAHGVPAGTKISGRGRRRILISRASQLNTQAPFLMLVMDSSPIPDFGALEPAQHHNNGLLPGEIASPNSKGETN